MGRVLEFTHGKPGQPYELPSGNYWDVNHRDKKTLRKLKAERTRVKKEQKRTFTLLCISENGRHARPRLPLVITLTRIHPSRGGLDGDNAERAFKHIRDAIAKWLGLKSDKQGPKLQWIVQQEKADYFAVRIRIEEREGELDEAMLKLGEIKNLTRRQQKWIRDELTLWIEESDVSSR